MTTYNIHKFTDISLNKLTEYTYLDHNIASEETFEIEKNSCYPNCLVVRVRYTDYTIGIKLTSHYIIIIDIKYGGIRLYLKTNDFNPDIKYIEIDSGTTCYQKHSNGFHETIYTDTPGWPEDCLWFKPYYEKLLEINGYEH